MAEENGGVVLSGRVIRLTLRVGERVLSRKQADILDAWLSLLRRRGEET